MKNKIVIKGLLIFVFFAAIITMMMLIFIGYDEVTRLDVTKWEMRGIQTVLAYYKIYTGKLPSSEEGLEILVKTVNPSTNLPYFEQIPLDGWERHFKYHHFTDSNYKIISYGADGKPGGTGENKDIEVTGIK